MNRLVETENRAGISRATCGWKKAHLPLNAVRCYWRDVHSPAISRRSGIWDYRHFQYDAVRSDLFAPMHGVSQDCAKADQLMWLSDVRYLDDAALKVFGTSPDGAARAQLLADIELIVDRSTTYRTLGPDARTLRDDTGIATPQGVPPSPRHGVFFRIRGDAADFRRCIDGIAARWAEASGVTRLRVNQFETPDMEAERKAGYPIKTHPPEQQYQAWIDLTLRDDAVARSLLTDAEGVDYGACIAAVHAYPVAAAYTFVYGGRPTLAGLRGFAAWEAINALDATNQRQAALLEWMYGPVAHGGPVEVTP